MAGVTRRAALLGLGGLGGWGLSGLLRPDLPVLDGVGRIDAGPIDAGPTGTVADKTVLNDASGLSATPIHKHVMISADPGEALVGQIRAELAAARAEKRCVNVGAARHSMGGQAIPRDGTAITFDNGFLEADESAATYRVHGGARWSQVIAALDTKGWSPKVMQSNHDFGVAATCSVNAHGWPVPFGPMGSTVRSLRMVLPSGEWLQCSAGENADLFNLAKGGYGLAGIITDLDVEMVRNTRLEPRHEVMEASSFASAFRAMVDDPAVSMAYGRLNVDRDGFFTKALMVSYREAADQSDLPPASGSGAMAHAASRLYRAQLGNEPFKAFRWWNETVLAPTISSGVSTRNSLINEPVATLDDRNTDRTDILHEYFIGFDRFDAFLDLCRQAIPSSFQEFLNVTLRFVGEDKDSVLTYAPVPRIAAVMSFSQEMTGRAEADMTRLTRQLIDGVTAIGGSYYLPYRPHASVAQMRAAYPRALEFAAAKRALDPDLVLRNNLWDQYLGAS
jgi:FAD/FMN-containing dehydrogenase